MTAYKIGPLLMQAIARGSQKAYDETIKMVNAKLQSETDSVRIEVYKKILEGTLALKEENNRVLDRFGAKPTTCQETDQQAARSGRD